MICDIKNLYECVNLHSTSRIVNLCSFENCGRARAQNAGVNESVGQLILFLHADTLLPQHFDTLVSSFQVIMHTPIIISK